MAVTRIHTNQMADGIVTNAKIADATIQGGKLADDITYGSNITVSGNLTVNGTTTTIDTVNTTIDDPILLLGANQTGSGAVDLGIMGERGDDTNVFIGYDESANEFIAVETSSLDSATTIAVSDYSNMHVGGLTAEDNAAVTGSITGGSITFKLLRKSCTYFKPRVWSNVSIRPYDDQISANLNPNPFFPPTMRFSFLS